MVFLGVKYSPGLKGENVQNVDQPWCENWEFVTAINAAGEEFTDSAHRVLEVIGLPEPEPEPEPSTCDECFAVLVEQDAICASDPACVEQELRDYADCALTCTGPWAGSSQECVNSSSTLLDPCLDSATTVDDLHACFDEVYIDELITCSPPG